MSDEGEEDRAAIEHSLELFLRARPQLANRIAAFNVGEEELETAFLEWGAELQAKVDRLIPGLPQDEDRGAVLRAALEDLEEVRAELAERRGGILGIV